MAITRGSSPISFYRGDNPTYQYTIYDVNDDTGERTPVDLTGLEIKGQIRSSAGSSPKLLELPIIVQKDKSGRFSWQLSEDQAKAIDFTSGVYDIQLRVPGNPSQTGSSGSKVLTFLTGSVTVIEDITRTDLPRKRTGDQSASLSDVLKSIRGD